jgi:hypothetical protein
MKRINKSRGRALLFSLLLVVMGVACSGQEERPAVSENPTASMIANPVPTLQQEISAEPTREVESEVTAETVEPQGLTPSRPVPATMTPQPVATTATVTINGMPADQFIIMPPEVRDNIRQIYARGESLGRNPQLFSILGDSLIATPQSLAKWDESDFNLGDYAFLQPTIDQYAGSFSRYGASVRVGLHSWSVFDPLWADKEFCLANEDVLTCEIRLNNPSVMIIFLGSNDAGSPGGFNVNYRQLVETLIEQGIVPVLATKADRFEGDDNVNNSIIRKVATEFKVPLMEFDLLADTLPGRGLGPDNVHLTFLEPLDYSSPEIFTVGYPVHNLASLMTLDTVRREISREEDEE